MKLEVGDLVVIRDECKFKEGITSFHEKWVMSSLTPTVMEMATPTRAMGTVTAVMPVVTTRMAMEMVMEKQTGKSIKLKYCGYNWEPFDKIVGIVTEIRPEDHSDLDVIKIREQSGGTRYCRRYIIERAQESS